MTSRGVIVGVLVTAAVGGAGLVVTSSGGGGSSSGTANIWVQQGGGACAGGRSASLIDFAAAASPDRVCGSLDAACQAMSPGDLALIKGSTSYGAQVLSSSCNGTAGNVKRLCTAPGEAVVITANNAVEFDNSDYVEVCGNAEGWRASSSTYGQFRWEATSQNFATGYSFEPGTTGSGIDGVEGDANGYGGDADVTACAPSGGATICALNGVYAAGGTTDIYITDSDLCCNNDKLIFPDNNGTPNQGWLIEGNYLHDQVKLTVSGGAHYECFYGNGIVDFVIRGNVWNVCRATGAMNNTCLGGCDSATEPRNLTFENNLVLSTPEANTDVEHNPGIDGGLQMKGYLRYRNNYVRNGIAIYNNGVTELTGNVMPSTSNCAQANSTYNIYAVGTCSGTGDQTVSTIFSNDAYYADGASRTTSLNYCQSASSPVIGAGKPTAFHSLDILGRSRTADGDPDVGPYEGVC